MAAEPTRSVLSETTEAIEDYAKAIYALAQRGDGTVTTTALAERLGVTPASVSAMVKKLADRGLVFERVVLRTAAGGTYCPSVTRTLAAADGERGILLHSADGPSTFEPWEMCIPPDSSYGAGRSMLKNGRARLFVIDRYDKWGSDARYARSGTADIALESLHGPCEWARFYNGTDEPIDAWCELGTYTVRAEASLALTP